jgi:hypothetical protein
MRLALWVRDGEPPDSTRRIETVWRNPATPTVAAQVDATVKLVQAGVLPADSDVTLEMAGLTEGQRQRIAVDRRRSSAAATGGGLLDRLAAVNERSTACVAVGCGGVWWRRRSLTGAGMPTGTGPLSLA